MSSKDTPPPDTAPKDKPKAEATSTDPTPPPNPTQLPKDSVTNGQSQSQSQTDGQSQSRSGDCKLAILIVSSVALSGAVIVPFISRLTSKCREDEEEQVDDEPDKNRVSPLDFIKKLFNIGDSRVGKKIPDIDTTVRGYTSAQGL